MNNTYILLRNNIESSALTLADLKQIGLLPTDLLWVECQSVSWRHPHEIPELKNLATEPVLQGNKSSNDESLEKFAPPHEDSTANNTKKNLVYVKLPKADEPLQQKNGNNLIKEDTPLTNKEADYNTPVTTATRITHPTINDTLLDFDIPETYTRKPAQKERMDLMEFLLSLPRKKVALYAGLLIAGAVMMLVIRGTGGNDKVFGRPVSQQTETINNTPVEEPAAPEEDTAVTPESYDQQNAPTQEMTIAPAAEQKVSSSTKPTVTIKKTEEKKEVAPPAKDPPVNNTPPVTEVKEEKTVPVTSIASQLHIKTNEYNVAAFGGIRNLQLTLQNSSPYFLDKVSVEVRYLNPEGALVQTGNIEFKFIQPGEASTIAIKKSSRGVKVSYKIIKIESKELAAGNTEAGGNNYSKN